MSTTTDVLRHRPFRYLTAGRAMTVLANSMAPVALSFAVLDLTGSVSDLGLVVGARSLANVLALLFGGVLADRVRRSVLLQGSALGAALVQGGLAVSLLLHWASLPLLVVLSLANGVLAALSFPAAAALMPQTVPPGELRQANAVARMGVNLGMIAGSSLGGLLAATAGAGWALAVDAAALAVAGGCYLLVRQAAAERVAERAATRPLAELRDGWREFASRSWIWVVVLQFLVVNAAYSGSVQVLGPGIAQATIGRTAWGVALAVQMAGAVVAGLLATRLRVRRALLLGVALVGVDALTVLTLAQRPGAVALSAMLFVSGFALELFGVAWDLSLQQNVPADRLARVYSIDALGSFLALPLGEMAVGPLSHRFGQRPTLLVAAALIALATGAALTSRAVRTLAVREEPTADAPTTEVSPATTEPGVQPVAAG
ncbi:MFS transporter [Kitasatospora kifunensis]|uniref:MFS family permease n=1 Tax=Kitasatospora kifunensis TaxID=58351 RepID=A0A7W7R5P3_KITKI|nr:MFS transporter [Kitasatospora kifunensis]MBB4925760.1 MFS family permease [Kitasatospora kifunensis]